MANKQQYDGERKVDSVGYSSIVRSVVVDRFKLSTLPTGCSILLQLLESENEETADASRHDHESLLSLLPASCRKESGDLASAGQHVAVCVARELDLHRLASIRSWLWVAGVPLPPRPLHHQLLLGLEIIVTDRIDISSHLDDLPDVPQADPPSFWSRRFGPNIYCSESCSCAPGNDAVRRGTAQTCQRLGLRQTPFRGNMSRWNQYGGFFHDRFAWLAFPTVYITIVLAAMQVGLVTKIVAGNDECQYASYGFAVFAILGPLIVAWFITLPFCCIFTYNWIGAVNVKKSCHAKVKIQCRMIPGPEFDI